MREGQIRKLERERIEAFTRRDDKQYFMLCDTLGVIPEDRDLYELGFHHYKMTMKV